VTGPTGINNVGQIVGFYDDQSGARHGFLYDRGAFTSFDFPGSQMTAPADINDRGQIVGVYADADNIGLIHSFVLDDGRFTPFDVPFPNVIFTDSRGIDNRGQIVGRYLVRNPDPSDIDNPVLNHGFIATPETEPKSKSPLLVTKPNDFSHSPRWPQDVDQFKEGSAKWARQLH